MLSLRCYGHCVIYLHVVPVACAKSPVPLPFIPSHEPDVLDAVRIPCFAVHNAFHVRIPYHVERVQVVAMRTENDRKVAIGEEADYVSWDGCCVSPADVALLSRHQTHVIGQAFVECFPKV